MAKTISQSITSIETSETSLESSLSKCKTSIANKGVSVPSTTRFSGLPALIDKIDTDLFEIRVVHPYLDNIIPSLKACLNVVGEGDVSTVRLNGGQSHDFMKLDRSKIYMVFYGDVFSNRSDYLSYYASMGTTLEPVIYIIFCDKMDSMIQSWLTDSNKSSKLATFVNKGNFLYCLRYAKDGKYLRMSYYDSSGKKRTADLSLATPGESHTHVIIINFENTRYSEYTITSNQFNTLQSDIYFKGA